MDRVEVEIEVRGPFVIAIMLDGSEIVLGTYEYLSRVAHGEFNED